jgi:Protein of unknown function (DUF3828)
VPRLPLDLPCANSRLKAHMRSALVLLVSLLTAATLTAADLSAKDLVAQFYQAHRSKHDPLDETRLLDRYFDAALLKLYLKDKREAKGEVGRLDGDPLYNAQDIEISEFSVSAPEMAGGPSRTGIQTRVTVHFKNLGKATRILYMLTKTADGWRISDIRYDDGSSLKKILQGKL